MFSKLAREAHDTVGLVKVATAIPLREKQDTPTARLQQVGGWHVTPLARQTLFIGRFSFYLLAGAPSTAGGFFLLVALYGLCLQARGEELILCLSPYTSRWGFLYKVDISILVDISM